MLRNLNITSQADMCLILNEVLSLNAQECTLDMTDGAPRHLLNEVLSLNAQEFRRKHDTKSPVAPQ